MAKNEDDKKDLTNRQLQRRAADLWYAVGNAIGGQRPTGGFASVMGGLYAYGTHRDGRPGVLFGSKFVPITRKAALDYGFDSSLYGKGDGNNNNNNNNNNDGNGNGKGRDPFKVRDFEFKPRLNQGASWNRTVGAYMYPNDKKDASNRGPIRHDGQNRSVIPDTRSGIGMKSGGLVRGAGKAERGRGKGKMV